MIELTTDLRTEISALQWLPIEAIARATFQCNNWRFGAPRLAA